LDYMVDHYMPPTDAPAKEDFWSLNQ